jgi:hypothetical protein
VDLYARLRRACHVEGTSRRQAARVFRIDQKTAAKMLRFSVPPGYRRSRPPARPTPVVRPVAETAGCADQAAKGKLACWP